MQGIRHIATPASEDFDPKTLFKHHHISDRGRNNYTNPPMHVYCIFFFSSRRRRAASYVTFTENQVHLLPGYPKQISVVPLLASLAFYVQFPPGSSVPVIKKDVLANIVQGSLVELSSSINANISSVQILFADTTTVTTPVTAAIPTEKDRSKMHAIIGGCVAAALLLILVIIATIWYCKKRKKIGYVNTYLV